MNSICPPVLGLHFFPRDPKMNGLLPEAFITALNIMGQGEALAQSFGLLAIGLAGEKHGHLNIRPVQWDVHSL
ncbi:hypothetical protein XELAEV_18046937mg [Xenopus laevis]|uniref:Uncharacterized protein n=1 Tax=Xenopus laevis TaxID=8355 RepID=A0A974BU02_XENLA|nr:hypothetical protein XELAEV_18046937mg [Xenopus laevis]